MLTGSAPISAHDPLVPAESASHARHVRRRTARDLWDRRTAQWHRRQELIAIYRAALGPEISDALSVRIEAAAEMRVVAERARANHVAGEAITLDDVVRIERAASHAEKLLGIGKQPAQPAPTLSDYLESKRSEDAEASQRATAKVLGVSEQTVARDLGKSRGAPSGAQSLSKPAEIQEPEEAKTPNGAPSWFQDDVDPAELAKAAAA